MGHPIRRRFKRQKFRLDKFCPVIVRNFAKREPVTTCSGFSNFEQLRAENKQLKEYLNQACDQIQLLMKQNSSLVKATKTRQRKEKHGKKQKKRNQWKNMGRAAMKDEINKVLKQKKQVVKANTNQSLPNPNGTPQTVRNVKTTVSYNVPSFKPMEKRKFKAIQLQLNDFLIQKKADFVFVSTVPEENEEFDFCDIPEIITAGSRFSAVVQEIQQQKFNLKKTCKKQLKQGEYKATRTSAYDQAMEEIFLRRKYFETEEDSEDEAPVQGFE